MDQTPADQLSLHVPRMYRVANRILADTDKAHDIVQEACLKALAKQSSFNGTSTLATWLHRITVNCAKDAIRSEIRNDNARKKLHIRAERRDDSPCPAQSAESNELGDLAWKLLEQLPDDCRSAFALTQLDGYSYDEAAEIENQPRGTIASRVYRAKKMLQEQMNAHIDGRAKS